MIFWADVQTAAAVVAVVALSRRGDAFEPPVQSEVAAGTPASVITSRTWHVAPKELTGLPAAAQVRTISEAATKAGPGDTVVIHDGIYRETVTVEKSGTAGETDPLSGGTGRTCRHHRRGRDPGMEKRARRRENLQRPVAAPLHWLEQDGHASGRRLPQDDRALRTGLHPWLPSAAGARSRRCSAAVRSMSIWTPNGSTSARAMARTSRKNRRSSNLRRVRCCGEAKGRTFTCAAFVSALRRTWPSTARRSSRATTASSRTASSSR